LLAAACSAAGALLRASLGEQATIRLRRRLLAHAEELALPFAQREHDGRTAALFLNDAPIVAGLLSGTLFAGVGTLVVLTLGSALQTGQSVVSLFVSLAIYGYGGYLVVEGQATLGSVLASGALFGQLFGPIGQLFGLVASVQKARSAADRLDAFLRERPSVSE